MIWCLPFSAFPWSHKPAAVSWSKGYMCAGSCPNVAAGTSHHLNCTFKPEPHTCFVHNLHPYIVYLLCQHTGYRSPLNDFQRSEGRELVATPWNAARVLLLPGLNLEDCATRCSQSLDCRYPASTALSTLIILIVNARRHSTSLQLERSRHY